jgi:hypothetical protein
MIVFEFSSQPCCREHSPFHSNGSAMAYICTFNFNPNLTTSKARNEIGPYFFTQTKRKKKEKKKKKKRGRLGPNLYLFVIQDAIHIFHHPSFIGEGGGDCRLRRLKTVICFAER